MVPEGDFEASPSEFFIGQMSPDDFLPASFEIPTKGLQDGAPLGFKIVYRVGRDIYETAALNTVLNLEAAPARIRPLYIAVPVVVIGLAAGLWRWRRGRWA